MRKLSRQDVLEIAHLARLGLEEEEIERLRGELGSILEHMDRLRELDTEGIEPMTHAVPMDLRLRPDEVGASLSQDEAVGAAPEEEDGQFRVPHILETAGK